MDHKKVGQLIAIKRKEMNMTQKQLADKLAVSNKAVSKWETGDGYPDITIVPTLADVLGLTTDELLSGKKSDRIESYNSIDNFSFKRDEIWINETILKFKNSCIISFAFAILGIIVYWVLWHEFPKHVFTSSQFYFGIDKLRD